MKKNKKIKALSLWRQWRQSPQFFKTLLVVISFFILFVPPLIVAWKLYKDRHNPTLLPPSSSIQTAPKQPVQNSQSTQTSHRHLQRTLLIEVVSGETSPKTLKFLLQKTPEPWAQNLLTQLAPIIDDIKNYPQLEKLFKLSIPPERPPFWEHIKTMFRSPSLMSRIMEKREYQIGWLGAIHKALHSHNIQNALYYFEKLSPQEQAQLTSWNDYARRLLAFETILKTNPISDSPEVQQEKSLQTANKLIVFALLNGIMEELFPPQALITFLQKSPEPWAQNLLTKVVPIIHDTGSYSKLEEYLIIVGSLRSVQNPIHIRKIDQSGEYKKVEIEDIQRALRNHDIQKALKYYEDLDPIKKNILKEWSDYAQRLQILDTEKKKLYLEIMEELN